MLPVTSSWSANIEEQGFGILLQATGCMDRPEINFKTAVAEGKQRRQVRSKTPASRAARMMFCRSSLVLRGYRSVQMFKIYIKP